MTNQITMDGMDEPMDYKNYWERNEERIMIDSFIKNPSADPEEIVRICCEIVYDDIIEYAQERIKDNDS